MGLVQVIPLGGVGEIGKNCTAVRQGDDIVVIDCGLSFPDEEMLGIDIIVPDFAYLVENRDKVRGVFLTHAHEDHVGGLPYLLPQLNCPIYGTEFTFALIRSRIEERVPYIKPDFRVFKPGDIIEAGSMSVEPIRVTHSIPESCCMAVRTEHGVVFFTGDFKFDFTPVDGKLANITRIGEIGREGVIALLSDSTNIERPGWGPSEREVSAGLRAVFTKAPGRVLLTTFASNIHRMQQVCEVAAETGRKVAVVGRRMEQNLDICSRMGYVKIPSGVRVTLDESKLLPDDRLAILTTGSQGEPMSALVQMSKGSYGRFQIKAGDTLIYSARPIPGNESAIFRTINRLFDQGCRVIYESPSPIHVSGHAYQEELKMMVNLTRPYYIAPVHGEARHQFLFSQIAKDMGYPDHRIFVLQDGVPLNMDESHAWLGDPVPAGRVLVDNTGQAGVTDEVLRDRYNLANDGIVLISIAIDATHGELVGDPVIQAKGFFDPEGVLEKALEALEDMLRSLSKDELKDVTRVKHDSSEVVKRLIQRHLNRRPLMVPSIVEV